jgi:hypothetical protein
MLQMSAMEVKPVGLTIESGAETRVAEQLRCREVEQRSRSSEGRLTRYDLHICPLGMTQPDDILRQPGSSQRTRFQPEEFIHCLVLSLLQPRGLISVTIWRACEIGQVRRRTLSSEMSVTSPRGPDTPASRTRVFAPCTCYHDCVGGP